MGNLPSDQSSISVVKQIGLTIGIYTHTITDQHTMNSFQHFLTDIYSLQGDTSWVHKNGYVFGAARRFNVAIGGSIGIALSRKKAVKPPGDLDFIASDIVQACAFISDLEEKLLSLKTYYSIKVNSGTEFCPPGSSHHFRIQTAFWLPICVMVRKDMKHWRTIGGNFVQDFTQVIAAAKALDERDGKGRVVDYEEAPAIPSSISMSDDTWEDEAWRLPTYKPAFIY